MATTPFKINGLEGLKKQLQQLVPTMEEEIDFELKASADVIVADAKRNAPVDIGDTRQGISAKKTGNMEYEVVSATTWSAFVEFGTRTKVEIPAGYEDFAAQFRGQKGEGTLDDFFVNILEWVRRKGIAGTYSVKTQKRTGPVKDRAKQDEDAAYAIMYSILTKGINPHPFFIPAIEAEKPKLIERIKNIVT